ncbi:MAG: beta strand repeat-containing protein, partial [Leptothrix ochracea]
ANIVLASTKLSTNSSDLTVTLSAIPADASAISVQLLDSLGAPIAATPSVLGSAYTFAALPDATYSARVSYTDAAGNASAFTTAAASLTPDTIAPAAAAPANVVLASTKLGTNSSDITVSLSAVPLDASAINVQLLDSLGAPIAATPSVLGSAYTFAALPDATYSARVSYTDAAGNASAFTTAALSLTPDTIAPVAAAPANIVLASTKLSTNSSDLTVTLSAIPADASAISVQLLDSLGAPIAATPSVLGSAYTFAAQPDATYSARVSYTDAAGNASAFTTAALSLTPDTIAPVAAAPANLVLASTKLGTNSSDITVSLSAIPADASAISVQLLDSLGAPIAATPSVLGSAYTFAALPDATYSARVSYTDAAGNASAFTTAATSITPDTIAPTALGLSFIDTGIPGDGITSLGTVQITGTLEAGAVVEYGTKDALGNLVWAPTFTAQSSVAGTLNQVWIRQTDAAGNASFFDPAVPATSFTFIAADPAPSVSVTDTGSIQTAPALVITNSSNLAVVASNGSTNFEYSFSPTGATGSWVAATAVNGLINIGALAQGGQTVLVHSLDALNRASADTSVSFVFDSVAPTAPSATLAYNPVTQAVSAHLSLPMDAVAGDVLTVNIADGVGSVQSTPITLSSADIAAGSITLPVSATLVNGTTYTVSANLTDAAGNASGLSTATPTSSLLFDNVAPTAPGLALVLDSANAGNTGVPNPTATDGVSTAIDLRLASLEAGASLQYRVNAGSVAGGTWISMDPTTLAVDAGTGQRVLSEALLLGATPLDGTYTIQVSQTDAAGNVSPVQTLTTTRDTTLSTLTGSFTDTGSSAVDSITRLGTIALGGLDANVDQVSYTLSGTDAQGVAIAPITGLVNLAQPSLDLGVLAGGDGTYTVTLVQADKAGNNNTATPLVLGPITLDTVAPTAPVTANLNLTSIKLGANSSDVTVTLSAVPLDATSITVELLSNGLPLAGLTPSVVGSAYTFAAQPDATYSARVSYTDTAGNTSATATSGLLSLDTVAPNAPSVALAYDPLTLAVHANIGLPVNAVAGDSLSVVVADGAVPPNTIQTLTVTLTSTDIGLGTVSLALNTALLTSGSTYSASGTLTDAAGNASAASAPASLAFDNIAPTPATIGLSVDSALGGTNTDLITNNAAITVSGLEPGAVVGYSLDGGAWTSTYSAPAANGAHTVQVRQTDAAGNTSTGSLSFTYDTQAPAQPVNTVFTPVGGLAPTALTTSLPIGALVGDTVTLNVLDLQNALVYSVQTSLMQADLTLGTVNLSLGAGLTNGSYQVQITLSDVAGNTSPSSTPQALQVGAAGPLAATIALVNDTGSVNIAGTLTDLVTTDARLNIGLDPALGITTQYSINSLTPTSPGYVMPTTDGSYTVRVFQTNVNGTTITPFTFTLDTVCPKPVVALTADTGTYANDGATTTTLVPAGSTNDGRLTVTGLDPHAAEITYFVTPAQQPALPGKPPTLGGQLGPFTWAVPTGSSSVVVPVPVDPLTGLPLADGTYQIDLFQTDKAGNVSATSSIIYTLDTTATAPMVSLINITQPATNTTSFGAIDIIPTTTEISFQTAISVNNGPWTDVNHYAPVLGLNNVRVHVIDLAGNVSPDTLLSFTLASDSPVANNVLPTVAFTHDSAPGLVTWSGITSTGTTTATNADHLTNDASLTVTPALATDTIEYSVDGGLSWIGAPTTGTTALITQTMLEAARGNPLINDLNFPNFAFYVHEVSATGSVSPAAPALLTLDMAAPMQYVTSGSAPAPTDLQGLYLSQTNTTLATAVMRVTYNEAVALDAGNTPVLMDANGLPLTAGYTVTAINSGLSYDGTTPLGAQRDASGMNVIDIMEFRFTETTLGSFAALIANNATSMQFVPTAEVLVTDMAGNAVSNTSNYVDWFRANTGLTTWQVHTTLP